MRKLLCIFSAIIPFFLYSQINVDMSGFNKRSGSTVTREKNILTVEWPTGKPEKARVALNLHPDSALFKNMSVSEEGKMMAIANNLQPAFILTVGKRDLISQNGWNIFFDKTSTGPQKTYRVNIQKESARVTSLGSRTIVSIGRLSAGDFHGNLELTMYHGSALINVAAVMSTSRDSTAIIYDAGLAGNEATWKGISWSDTAGRMQTLQPSASDTSRNIAVKYRTIVGENAGGSVAVFPAPHQYFYPLDEAFNLRFTWAGRDYRQMIPEYGIGIRQELLGDKRWVPWFNAPPQTRQRLNFFCLLSRSTAEDALQAVKRYTHNDRYVSLPGFKTMSSHFHNEFVMKVIVANKPQPDTPSFKRVFKNMGVDIVHLGEFHYTAHPKGPDELRLLEMKYMFDMCSKYSDNEFLLLPGEEPNEFFGGHWMQLFPRPVYWIMSRKENKPFISEHPMYGKVYRVGDKQEMLNLLELERGLAWTAHARTKGSTGYPDKYKDESFFTSDRFFGAAWKPIPADLSIPKLGVRVLDLMDDMANWGLKKYAIAEADLFTIEPENEMYAHMNVNYLRMDSLPQYEGGWQPVLDAMENGKFFSGTGEILIPEFTVDGKRSGDTLSLRPNGKAKISVHLDWTFPLNFVEIISGDGKQVYREKKDLSVTESFGSKQVDFQVNLKGRKWVRIEVWDVAANGAFSQVVWLE